jgi:peptidoglycan hydrolase-like protein with peptidoglycan-binding domain
MILAEIQGQLTNKALYSGAQDGLMGPSTAEAIKTYQTIEKLEINGRPSQELLMQMISNATKSDILK